MSEPHHFYTIDSILLDEDRQRKHFGDIELSELSNDILTNGLYHPIVVRQAGQFTILVAGERRLRAIRMLGLLKQTFRFNGQPVPLGFIPVNDLGPISKEQAVEIELHENIKRVDITWQERVDAESRLVELRRGQAQADGLPPPTMQSIAAEIGVQQNTLRESEVIAKLLHEPAVAKAPDKRSALKAVERIRQEQYNRTMAAELSAAPPESRHRFIKGDALTVLTTLASEKYDCLIVDPPYFIGADNMSEQANANGRDYDDSPEHFDRFMEVLAEQTFRICQQDSHAYIFCSIERFWEVSNTFAAFGWQCWPRPIIWSKAPMGAAPKPEHGPRYTYEAVLFATKGDRRVTALKPDVIHIPAVMSRLHPDEKPVALYEELLSRSCYPGNEVIDPCGGSGTTFAAANRLSLTATVIEQSEIYSGLCLKRINNKE